MTKDKEHEAKRYQKKTKEKTKHQQVRDAHKEDKVESERMERPNKKGQEKVDDPAA